MNDVANEEPALAAKKRKKSGLFKKWLKRSLWAIAALGLLAMIVTAFLPKPIPVDLTGVRRAALRVSVDEDGRTRVTDRYTVSAPLVGSLARVELNPGDPVRVGQVIARMVPSLRPLMDAQTRAETEARVSAGAAERRVATSAVSRARVALQFAETQAARQRQLVAGGSISREALDQAELELRSAREELTSSEFGVRVAGHQLEMSRAALGRLDGGESSTDQFDISSPIDGVVLRVMQRSGGAMTAGAAIMELGDPAHLEIAVDVLTSDAVHIEAGHDVIVERWGGEHELEGHVRLVEPSAFTRTSALGVEEQRVNVVIDLDSPREIWARLGDGFRVETRIIIWEEEDILHVPLSTVFRRNQGWAAYRLAGDNVELVEVETGRRNGLSVQILGGLEEGDQVVAHPSDTIVDGATVVAR